MKKMRKRIRGCVGRRKVCTVSGWNVLSLFGVLAAAVFALLCLCLKQKNDQYRDALIALSERLPEEETFDGARKE